MLSPTPSGHVCQMRVSRGGRAARRSSAGPRRGPECGTQMVTNVTGSLNAKLHEELCLDEASIEGRSDIQRRSVVKQSRIPCFATHRSATEWRAGQTAEVIQRRSALSVMMFASMAEQPSGLKAQSLTIRGGLPGVRGTPTLATVWPGGSSRISCKSLHCRSPKRLHQRQVDRHGQYRNLLTWGRA